VTRYFYTLTFTHTFEHDDDTVFFSYSYPYTLSDLRNDISLMEKNTRINKLFTKSVLCKTLSGDDVPMLTVTARKSNSCN